MTSTEEQIRAVVARQAADWFIANQGATPDYSERAAFFAWLKASPIHVEEYLGIALVARDLPAAADDPQMPLELLLELARADAADNVVTVPAMQFREPVVQRAPLRPRWSLAAAAAVVLLAASVLWWFTMGDPGDTMQTYRTAHGEQAVQQLADGSTLHLNTETIVNVDYGRDERIVRLERGQALFDVEHGDPRPFRVVAGDAEIVAIGTQFDVHHEGQSTVVTVVKGRVDVFAATSERATTGSAPSVQHVAAGFQLRIDGGIMSPQTSLADVSAAVAWLQRKIVFEHRPLGEVADEFNRYGMLEITIDDATLRALPVSGVFDAYDTISFAAFLGTLDGVRVERTTTQIHIVNMKGAKSGEGPAAN